MRRFFLCPFGTQQRFRSLPVWRLKLFQARSGNLKRLCEFLWDYNFLLFALILSFIMVIPSCTPYSLLITSESLGASNSLLPSHLVCRCHVHFADDCFKLRVKFWRLRLAERFPVLYAFGFSLLFWPAPNPCTKLVFL